MKRLRKRLFAIVLALFILVPFVNVDASTGTGSLDDPLIVTTPQELSDALDNKNIEYVKLGSDINLETATIGSWGNRIYVLDNDRIVDLNGYQLTHYGLVIRFYNSPDAGSSYGKLTIKDSSSAGTGKIRTGMGAGINANTFSGAVGPDITHEIIIDDVDFVYAGDDHFSVLGISSTSSPSHKLNCVIKNVNVSLYDNSGEGHLSFVDALESEKNNVTVEIQNSKIESAKTYNSVQKTNNADGLTSVDLSYFVKDTTTIKIDDVEQAHTTDAKTLGKKIEVGNIAQYTVTFNTDGGSAVANQTINAGEKATRPATDPTKTNYTFDDWYTDATYTTKFDFANTTITSDTTIYAKFISNPTTYTVTFDTDGGSIVANQTVNAGEKATRPTDPTKTDYVFDVWCTDAACTTEFDFDTLITANTIIYAHFVKQTVFTYYSAGEGTGGIVFRGMAESGTSYDVDTFEYFSSVFTAPTGKHFAGWNLSNGTQITKEQLDSSNSITMPQIGVTLTSSLTFTAYYEDDTYTVTFDTDGGSTVANQTINAGEKATRPTDPTKTNYTFDDWYTDATYTTKFDFANTTITGDTVIYAKFTPNATTYTITVTNGNSSKASAEKDETITLTANTPEFGKEFDKWVVESGTITLADATSATTTFTMPEENVSVKATYKSTHSTYTVTFESNGGSEVESQTLTGSGVSDSANVTKPTDPTKTGYTFDGWYKDSALTEEFDFFVGITSDLTLYAKWTENSVTPTYTIETGDGQSFTLGDTNDIEIKASGELAKLTEIKVDGTTLASSNYTTASGSTILTLLNSYLNTLSEGNHTVTFVYNDGEVDATLKVLAAQNTSGDDTNTTGDNTNTGTETNNNTTNDSSTGSPQTGDNIVNYVITLILSIIGLAGGSLYLNKKKIFANK